MSRSFRSSLAIAAGRATGWLSRVTGRGQGATISGRVMNAIAWTYVILAEAVNPEYGLGYMVELARTHQKASWSFAGLLVIGGIGLLTDFLIRLLSSLLFRWREAS